MDINLTELTRSVCPCRVNKIYGPLLTVDIISPESRIQMRFDVAHARMGLSEFSCSENPSNTVFRLQFIPKDFTNGVFSIKVFLFIFYSN